MDVAFVKQVLSRETRINYPVAMTTPESAHCSMAAVAALPTSFCAGYPRAVSSRSTKACATRPLYETEIRGPARIAHWRGARGKTFEDTGQILPGARRIGPASFPASIFPKLTPQQKAGRPCTNSNAGGLHLWRVASSPSRSAASTTAICAGEQIEGRRKLWTRFRILLRPKETQEKSSAPAKRRIPLIFRKRTATPPVQLPCILSRYGIHSRPYFDGIAR